MLSSLRKVKFSVIEYVCSERPYLTPEINLFCFTNGTFYHAGKKTSEGHQLEELRKAQT